MPRRTSSWSSATKIRSPFVPLAIYGYRHTYRRAIAAGFNIQLAWMCFTRSCMLGMPTPSPRDNFPFCLGRFPGIPLPLSLISSVIFPGSRSIRILAWGLPECRWMLVRLS